MLPHWESRPIEIANLLNPAFGSLLIRETAVEYEKTTKVGLPYAVAFLVLPLSLHRPTREALPSTSKSLLHAWIQEHPAIQALVPERTRRLRLFSREAILFGLQNGVLKVAEDGRLQNARKGKVSFSNDAVDARNALAAAGLLGRWFGKVSDPSLIFAMWGMRP